MKMLFIDLNIREDIEKDGKVKKIYLSQLKFKLFLIFQKKKKNDQYFSSNLKLD